MNIDLIPPGDNPPHELNVFIEVPIGGEPVKYEYDKKAGAMFVDRILHTPMRYPANYGFIPQTLCDDGDPLDCLVMTRWALLPGTIIRARPVGVLHLEDEAGGDEKLLAVPVTKVSPYYKDVQDYTDLPPIVVQSEIAHQVAAALDVLLDDAKRARIKHQAKVPAKPEGGVIGLGLIVELVGGVLWHLKRPGARQPPLEADPDVEAKQPALGGRAPTLLRERLRAAHEQRAHHAERGHDPCEQFATMLPWHVSLFC